MSKIIRKNMPNSLHVVVDKKLALEIGFVEAGLMAELVEIHKLASYENNFFKNGDSGEWFVVTQKEIESRIGLKRTQYENAMKTLLESELVAKKRMGIPAKNYFLILRNDSGEIQLQGGEQ
jgi:hypothetical protein